MKPLETSISVSFVLMQTVLLVTMNTGYSNSIVCARQRRRADGTCLPEYVSAYKQKQSPKLTTDSSREAVVRNINAMIFMPNPNDSSINLDDQEMRAAALMAIDRVEKEGLISPKRYIWKKENFSFAPVGCDERKSLLQVHSWFSGQLQQNGTILADLDNGIVNLMYAIGLHCNGICRSFAQLYSAIDIPVIGTGCNSKELQDKSRESGFPYFARVIGSSEGLTVARHDFLSSHSLWTRIKILTLNDPDRLEAADQLKQYFRTANIKQTNQVSVDLQKLPKSCGEEPTIPLKEKAVYKDIKNILKAARTAYNIFILMMYDCEVIAVMVAAHELNMFSDPYIRYSFITNSFTNAKTLEKFWQGGEDIMRESIEGLISINIHRPDLPWSMYERKLRQFVLDLKNTDNEEIKLGGDLSVYSGLLFDAIYLFGQAIQYATQEGKDLSYYKMGIAEFFHTGYKYTAAPSAISHSLGYDFTLATGEYVTDKYKDRISTYAVEIINNGEFLPMFIWRNNENPKLIAVKGKFKWPGNHMDAPPGQPNCPEGIVNGWTNPTCTPLPPALSMNAGEFLKRYKYALLGGLIGLVIILVGLLMIFFRKKKIEAAQKKVKHWLINWRDIITEEKKDKMTETIHRVLQIEANKPMIVANRTKMGFYGQVGVVKGLVCCIAHIDKDINPNDPDLLYDLMQMNNLRHENVNQFIGICREKPHQCIVTLYGKFGSLSDIITDGTILITTEFQLSFVTDIACGIEYLHTTNLGYHGHLKSTNIIVDNKWTCKITDFGMSMLQEWKVRTSNKSDMLYLAPELLRESPDDFNIGLGSQAGDIYAFAIIMQEISMKDIPYAIERRRKPLNEIISLIASTDLEQPFRPLIPPNTCSSSWLYVMASCWNEDPEARPVSKQIVQAFRRLAKGKTIYIIDIMLENLEKHTDKLERLVAQRAGELNEKQKEVETLLFKILPEVAARSLVDKGFVEPEFFSLATIYFSDVVGFTKMCQTSTPFEVVSFLNAAFAVFDDVTDLYNVYKCETIRDVYMVASGLPIRNGEKHASEIATMALHLLSTVTTFTIPHRPSETLQLRIGMHTGSVVAGVVGIKMPHYCLFGDTINTAARMQTGGYALRIHMSNTTTDLLRHSEDFIIELRGDIEVKGKGLMTTYWLTGKQGFNLPLPSLSLAAPMEDHYFK